MTKIDPNKLLISSDFYSLQGEGISSGIPSYFIRLGICNLRCGVSVSFMNQLLKEKKLADGEVFKGDLEQDGKATWTCDSISQWLWRGEDKEFQYLIDRWKDQGIYDDIRTGKIHLIWTGGEPTIIGHQVAIRNFYTYWTNLELYNTSSHEFNPYSEIETNGTIYINDDLFEWINQINCSPKLSNSGMSPKQRINPVAIRRIMEHSNYQFKFVVSTEDDIIEMFDTYIDMFNIPLKNIVCMPGMDSQEQFHERTRFIMEMAKKYKFRGMSRMHISAWDKTLNV